MTDQYIRDLLRVSVSQICQTIGYNSIQMTPLELLTDNLHKFLQEFSKDLHRHVELFNRTEANCDDATLTLANLNIGLNDINEYVTHVQAVPCAIDIPKFPARKESYLNFLKPGSKEVLTRPVHIYEYLPPILNDEIDDIKRIVTTITQTSTTITTTTTNTTTTSLTTPFSAAYSTPGSPLQAIEAKKDDNILDGIEIIAAATGTSSANATIASAATTTTTTTSKKDYTDDNTIENSCNGTSNGYKLLTNGISLNSDSKPALLSTTLETTTSSSSSSSDQQIPQKIRSVLAGRISTTDSTEGRPTREISSVMMTTGGFISPAIEGKLPDTKIPELIEAIEIAASTPQAPSVPSPSPAHLPQQQQQQHQQPTQQTASLMPLLSSTSLSTTSPIPSSSNSSAIRTSSNVTNLSMMSSQSQHMLQSNNKSTTGGETADINNPSIKNLSSLRMAKKKNQNNPAMQMMLSNYDRQMMKKVSKRKGGIQSSSSSSANGSTKFHMSPNVVGSSNLVNSLPQLSNSNLFSSASTQLTTPTASGTGTNEKTKKKRLKLIQKSTNKSSSNNNNASGNGGNMNLDRSGGISGGNIGYHSKMKNCYNLSKLDRTTEMNDKLMRKQQKLKQKRLRHQIQKRQTNQKLLDSVSPMSQNTMHDDILAKKHLAIGNNESPEKFKTMRKDTFNSTILQLSQSNNDSLNNDTPTAVGGIGIGGGVGGGGGATSTTATLFHEQSSIASVNANLNDSLFSMSKNKLSTTSDEIKLSTEPDRTKLNIFKKISSSSRERRDQKSITGSSSSSFLLPSDGSAGAAATSSNALFLNENHQQQQIGGLSCLPNLPSGTTITPTPPSGRHVYAPPSSSSSTPPTITGATATTPAIAAATSLPTSAAGDNSHISEYDGDSKTNNFNPNTGISKAGNDNSIQLINKPKKRGRKPGSKNQPKIPPVGGSHDVNIKKPKKLRMLMNIYGTGHGPQSAHDLMEPLNLTHGSVGTAGGLANIPLGIASTFPLYTQDGGGLRQLKKDHKKGKFKDSGHKRSSAAAKSLSSTIVSSSIVGPTKEEVDSINQKLLKMDTVLQPAPPLLSSPMQSSMDAQNSFAISKNLHSSSPASSSSTATKSKDNDLSPTKTSASNSKRHGNSSTSSSTAAAAAAATAASSSGTPDSSFVPPTFPNMPGMPGLSMFPYYPFPPRPGLIPAHGLFPQLGQMTNSSAGMFLSGLMRFRCMNSGMRLPSLLNGSGTVNAADDNNERNDRSSPQLSSASSVIDVDRNYCNVAPLVPPDTVKFELSNPQYAKNLKTSRGGGGTSMKSASSSSSSAAAASSSIAGGGGSDNMKSKLSPIMTSGFSAAGRSFQSQSSVNSPATQTPAAGHNFAFSDVNKSHFLSSTANTHHGIDIFRNNNNNNSNSNRSMLLKNNLDEGPIEVSDDSDDDDDDGDGNDDGNVGGGGAKKSNQQQFSSNNNSTFTRINTSNSSQRLHDNNDLISGYDQQQQQQQHQHQHERNKYPFNDSILSNDRSMIKDFNKKKKQKSDKKSAFAITDTGNYEIQLTSTFFDKTKLSINNQTVTTTTTNSLFHFPSSSSFSSHKDHNIDSNNLMTDEQISTITSGTGTASATTSTSTSFVLPKGGNKILNNSNSSGFETISSALGSINNNTSSISSAIVSSSSLLLSAASASFKLINDDQQRHRDHKKLKRINRDGKIKKKKDRKDKSKTKELLNKSDKYLYKFEKRKDKDEKQRDKDRLKKLKKEKKKEKQRPFDRTSLQLGQSKYIGCTSSSTSGISGPGVGLACSSVGGGGVGGIESSSDIPSSSMGVSLVPKLTLKLANSQSQMPQMNSISSSSSSSNDLLDKTGGIGLIGKQKSNNKSGTSNGSSSNLSNMKNNPLGGSGGGTGSSICGKVREPSPELARISPLVTRPPKQKTQIHVSNDNLNQATAKNVEDEMVYGTCGSSGNNSTKTILPAILDTTHIYDVTNSNSNENVIGWMTGGSGSGGGGGGGGGGEGEDDDEMKGGGGDTGNYISSTTSKPKLSAGITIPSITTKTERTSSLASTTTSVHKNNSIPPLISSAVRPSSYIDAEGNRVWICPACGKVDDGSAMIGCDGCDAWYHWVCVGIFVAPKDNEDWFCRVCITKKKGIHGNDKKRRRNKKKSGNV